jgi:hypothetical protein
MNRIGELRQSSDLLPVKCVLDNQIALRIEVLPLVIGEAEL